jgi:hypothetical protein
LIIEAKGLFGGDRLDACSDLARLYWPYFMAMSNTCGRLEINPKNICAEFHSFNKPPSEEQVMFFLGEYRDNFLLFIYRAGGKLWGQWDIDKKYLPRHPLAADKATPAPDAQEFTTWKKAYLDQKEKRDERLSVLISGISKSCENLREPSQECAVLHQNVRGVGVGVGGGGGVGKENTKPSDAAKAPRGGNRKMADATGETRHARIKGMIETAYAEHTGGLQCPWDGGEASQLQKFLSACPGWPDSQIAQCLENMYRSEGFPAGTRPREFLPKLMKYLKPLNKFNQESSNGQSVSKPQQRLDNIRANATEALRARVAQLASEPAGGGAGNMATHPAGSNGVPIRHPDPGVDVDGQSPQILPPEPGRARH